MLELFGGSGLAAGQAAEPPRPNIVLLLVDDLGWADVGCYGADLHETVNIDRLAGQSVRFTHAYAAAPVCSPTRAALMTGKHPARLGMTIWRESAAHPPRDRKLIPPITRGNLELSETTIAEVLHRAGYLTAHVGKWHLGDAAHYPENHGFDINVGGTLWGAPQSFFYPYRGSKWFGRGPRYVPHLEGGRPGEYLTDRLTDEAVGIIERAGDRPFFLHLAYHTVHTPIEAKPPLIERYESRLRPADRHRNPTYAAMVHSLDESVGRILAQLDRQGIAERTAVIFTSDNGGFVNVFQNQVVTSNAPLRSGKGSLYEGGVRIPCMVRWPGRTRPGAVCSEPIVSMDLYPTLLDVAGLEPAAPPSDAGVDGLSLVPLLEGTADRLERDALFWHYPHYYPTTTPVSAIRRGDWKLLEYHEDQHVELYHLEEDPGEKQDRSTARPQLARDLRNRLHAWRERVNAQMPTPNPG